MPNVYAAKANGNWTSGSTWNLVDPTSYSYSTAGNSLTTIAFINSAAFTPGAITIDGIGVYVFSREAVPGAHTVTVQLATGGVAVPGTIVTINSSDFQVAKGWIFFKFSAPVTLLAATAYTVGVKSSTGSALTLYTTNVVGDWTRYLRTTTSGTAPTTDDTTFICGEWTSLATNTPRTVTLDNTAATIFGQVTIGSKGTVSVPNTASTNFLLSIENGNLEVGFDGTLTNASMVSTSTAKISFPTMLSNNQWFVNVQKNGTIVWGVQNKTRVITKLSANIAAAGAVTFTVTDSVGTDPLPWTNTDSLMIANTTRSLTPLTGLDIFTPTSIAGTTINCSSLTNPHYQDSNFAAHVWNMTRNSFISGSSTAFSTSVTGTSGASVTLNSVEFKNAFITVGNFALGTISVQNCVVRDVTTGAAIACQGASGSVSLNVNNNILYLVPNFGTTPQLGNVNSNYIIGASTTGVSINGSVSTSINGWVFNCCAGNAFQLSEGVAQVSPTYDNMDFYGGQAGAQLQQFGWSGVPFALSGWKWWRNIGNLTLNTCGNLTINNFKVMGNANGGASPTGQLGLNGVYDVKIIGLNIYTDPTYSVVGNFSCTSSCNVIFEGCTMTPVCSISEIILSTTNSTVGGSVIFRNCSFGSSTIIQDANINLCSRYTLFGFEQIGGIVNANIARKPGGAIAYDGSITDGGHPTSSYTPTSATKYLESNYYKIKVTTALSVSGFVNVRKSVSFTGTVTVWLKQNYALGYTSDTLIGTFGGAAGSFSQMFFSIPAPTDTGVAEIFFKVNGTAGQANIGTIGGF